MSCVGPHHAVDETRGGLLLEPEAVANAIAGVDEDGEAQWQVGFGGELEDVLRLLVFANIEIVPGEVGNKPAAFVGDSKQEVDTVDFEGNAGRGVGRERFLFLCAQCESESRNRGGYNDCFHGRTCSYCSAGLEA